MLGLWQCAERADRRRAVFFLEAMTAALKDFVPPEFFEAKFDTPEEAQAQYALHQSRSNSILWGGGSQNPDDYQL